MKILTFGVFDYFHIGHLNLFKQCKQHADYLIVAVQDGNFIKYKPNAKILYSTSQLVEIIQSLRIVDEVIIYQSFTPITLSKIDFDILALGEDHIGTRFSEVEEWCIKNNKKVIRLKRTPGIKNNLSS